MAKNINFIVYGWFDPYPPFLPSFLCLPLGMIMIWAEFYGVRIVLHSNSIGGFIKSFFVKGAGVFMKFFQKSTFWLFLLEDIDIYQMLWSHENFLLLAKFITGQRSAPMCNSILRAIFNCLSWKTDFKTYLLLQFSSNPP